MSKFKRPLMMAAAVSSLALAGIAPTALARHGADDPAGHDAGDDHGGRVTVRAHARHGADDRGGKRLKVHVRHGHGADDGPGHR
jgi:hypothetical protein